ncbi:E3 ubiquitin-protein ligase RHA1B-like [Tripterygium wilfordii]|uniref:E3 ubiquitin-protein ligase RHA1B-like n=1 Tax=Tripterygium wilfordii TaxID=458696 RepID=A0A7J7CHL0_TRIWF|nr:E3 ubiquitin-protein ligase RHA1B-like [Tripterygium wilfordii]
MGYIGEVPEEHMYYYYYYYYYYSSPIRNMFALLDFFSDFIIWVFSFVELCNSLIKVGDTPNPTRLSDQVIEDFDGDRLERCTICLCELLQGGGGGGGGGGDEAMRLKKCKHGFHQGCIGQWTDQGHTRCPVCRTPYYDHEEKKQEFNNNNHFHWEAFDGFGSQVQD